MREIPNEVLQRWKSARQCVSDSERTHLEKKTFLLLVTACLIASLPELDLWDDLSSRDAKNNSISPQPGRH